MSKKNSPLLSAVATDLSRQMKVDGHLGGVCQTLGVSGQKAQPADIVRTNRRFGGDLRPITHEALCTVAKCGGPFEKLPFETGEVREDLGRLADLEAADAALERTRQKVRDEINLLRVKIGGAVFLIHDTTTTTLAHPFWDANEKERLDTAAGPFLRVIDDRQATITAAGLSTRAKNSKAASEIEEVKGHASRLEIENKYLAGEGLRPSDLGASARPAPAPRRRARTARR